MDLYSLICKGCYPKNIKVFYGNLVRMGSILRSFNVECLICISCHLGVSCVFIILILQPICLCITLLQSKFWIIIIEAFGWSISCCNTIFYLLASASLLIGHPFCGTKKTIWLAMLHAFFWILWGERNGCLILTLSPFLTFYGFGNWFYSFSWCKIKHPYKHYNFLSVQAI